MLLPVIVSKLPWPAGKSGKEITLPLQAVRYEGEKQNGLPHGSGILYYNDGARYSGEFQDGKIHGGGRLVLPDGSRYVGQFKDNAFHGYGVMTDSDGNKFAGEFENGVFVEEERSVKHNLEG